MDASRLVADLNSFAIFAKVAEHSSFSEAAHRLRVSVSTVSRRIAELEDQLGTSLLERTTRNIRLTTAGLEVLGFAREFADVAQEVRNCASYSAAEVSGTLLLACPPCVPCGALTTLLGGFQDAFPNVSLTVLMSEHLRDNGRMDDVDLAICVGKLDEGDRSAKRLLSYRPVLIASEEYLAGRGELRTPHDLDAHRLLAFADPQLQGSWTFDHRDGIGREVVMVRPYLASNKFAIIAAAVVAGRGIASIPSPRVAALSERANLVEVLPAWEQARVDLWLRQCRSAGGSKAVRMFRTFAAQRMSALMSCAADDGSLG